MFFFRKTFVVAKMQGWCPAGTSSLSNLKKHFFNGLAIDGKYTEWKESECSATCGGGVITKTRTCTNPAPQHGGKDCSELGPAEMTLSCNEQECRKLI